MYICLGCEVSSQLTMYICLGCEGSSPLIMYICLGCDGSTPLDLMLAGPDEAGIISTEYVLEFFQRLVDDMKISSRQTRVGLTPRLCSKDDQGFRLPGRCGQQSITWVWGTVYHVGVGTSESHRCGEQSITWM